MPRPRPCCSWEPGSTVPAATAHPTENWGLDDGLGMAAFFSKVAIKATQEWKEEIVFFNQYGGVYHPKLRDYVNPKFLGGEVLDIPRDQDPRPKFAEWLTSPQNPWFAKVMANRVWYWLLGRGIVHEPDDFRSTNPPSNPELLDYLTQEFVGNKFDVKSPVPPDPELQDLPAVQQGERLEPQ